MNLLGIDVGTTGTKVVLFSRQGEILASAYREYDVQSPQPGWAELDAAALWREICDAICAVTAACPGAPVEALSISSLGEALTPVSADRRILGPSILNFDVRGEEFLPDLAQRLPPERLFAINGNTLGNHYSLPKLKWIQAHQPDLYARAFKFLPWASLIAYLLGGEPLVDYSLANRTLLFDLAQRDWSRTLLAETGLDASKLPATVPSGTVVGVVADDLAARLGLPKGVRIVSGAHDQCGNAVGCGAIDTGSAVYGMGTYHCITPVFAAPPAPQAMIARGLTVEHHAAPERFVCFIYNQGGSLVKWFRNTFAGAEHRQAEARGESVYPALFAEIPAGPSSVMALPHFAVTGPPAFISDSSGVLAGLRLETSRGDILKGIIESAAFYLKEVVDALPDTSVRCEQYRVVGGGSQSDAWVQTCADIFGQPMTRPLITEAGALGAAILAGVGCGTFASFAEGVQAMVKLDRTFEPDARRHAQYQERYQRYRRLAPLMLDYLRAL